MRRASHSAGPVRASTSIVRNAQGSADRAPHSQSTATSATDSEIDDAESIKSASMRHLRRPDTPSLLSQLSSRPEQAIKLCPVDFSCPFIVCDLAAADQPIVDCSDPFQNLTGYSKQQIWGRNCRFLQHPRGQLASGDERQYTDAVAVSIIKSAVNSCQEVQLPLINYRHDGHPFLNLLTVVHLDDLFAIGLLLDVVARPQAVTERHDDGNYTINYRSSSPAGDPTLESDWDQIQRLSWAFNHMPDQASTVDWESLWLESCKDLVLVVAGLSTVVYCSPSSTTVLGCQPKKILGTRLSTWCHPSDIVPLTRELASAELGQTIDFLFRIRQQVGGYIWLETRGALRRDDAIGDESIVLVGRQRNVMAMEESLEVGRDGTIPEDAYAKVSRGGIILHVSGTINGILGRRPEDLVGTSMHDLTPYKSPFDLKSALDDAAAGHRVQGPHMLVDRRSRRLRVNLDIRPGDLVSGQPPSFFVVRMTRVRNERSEPVPETTSVPFKSKDAHKPLPELRLTRGSSWHRELEELQIANKNLAQDIQQMLAAKRRAKRRKPPSEEGDIEYACKFCGTTESSEWRRGPGGPRELCNSCGIKWAKERKLEKSRGTSTSSGKTKSDN